MNCNLLKNIKSACSYDPGGITTIWLLDFDRFVSYRFHEDGLYINGYVEKIYVTDKTAYELQSVAETTFTENKSGGQYKQELKTFVSTLDAGTLSSLLQAGARKYVVIFRNSQGKYFTFGSDGGASLTFTQQSGKEGEDAGYSITIAKNSIFPLFQTNGNALAHFPVYIPDFDQYAVCETIDEITPDPFEQGNEGSVHIWIDAQDGYNGYGFRCYDFDLARDRGENAGFQGTYRTIGIGEHEWTTENLKALHRHRDSVDFRWHDWTDENIAVITADYKSQAYEKPLSVDQFLQVNGTWFTLLQGLTSYREPGEYAFRTAAGGHLVEGWSLPDIDDIHQLIGQAPRRTGNFTTDVLDFVAASGYDLPDGYITAWNDRQNVSGLTLTPLGWRTPEGENEEDFDLAKHFHGFKEQTALLLKDRTQLFIFASGEFTHYTGTYAYGQVRYCRRRSAEELGYKLVINPSADSVVVLTRSEPTSLTDLPCGMERGIALRYMNRDTGIICKPWSEIQAEAEEIKAQIKIVIYNY